MSADEQWDDPDSPESIARQQGVPFVADGAAILNELRAVIARYVVLPSEHALVAVTLWIAATHGLPAFQHAPQLVIRSPEKRCGKSRLLDVIAGTCHRPLVSVNATVAAILRSIGDDHPPTLLVDEADAIFGTKRAAEQNEDLRALLNAGHQRGRPALRCVGPQQVPTELPTFTMAALAGIGDMPDTIVDRAAVITMRRRRNDEQVAQFRQRRDGAVLAAIQSKLAAWAQANIPALTDAEPAMPVEDRAADTWEPLVAVADLAGGDWPKRARTAAEVLCAEGADADLHHSLGVRLLTDVRDVFAAMSAGFMASQDLVAALRRVEEAPWAEYDLTARKLATRLRHFGVKPTRNTTGSARGYRREDLDDAFGRYLPDPPSESVRSVQSASDQGLSSDAPQASDTSNRQTQIERQDVTAGQGTHLTGLTGSDDPDVDRVYVRLPPGEIASCRECSAVAHERRARACLSKLPGGGMNPQPDLHPSPAAQSSR